jgi:hypothetical protein
MGNKRGLSLGVVTVSFLLGVLGAVSLPTAQAAVAAGTWVNTIGTQFLVGDALATIVPTAVGTNFLDPTCAQGGTSLALVSGVRLSGVNAVVNPVVLVVSCLGATIGSRLNFIGVDGKVIKQLSTTAVPPNGWAHFVHRQDKGDLLGCGANGSLYSIDYSQDTNTADGTATQLTPLPAAVTSCNGLAWDAEADVMYVGLSVNGGIKIGRVVSFKQGTSTLVGDFTNLPCLANGLAISGGVLLMSCAAANNPQPTDPTMFRLDKATGAVLGVFGKGTTADPSFHPLAGLGDLACDPVTFHADQATGRDLYTDALWSRLGANGNSVVALQFPAFTCGMPVSSVVVNPNGVRFSPLAAGLSIPGANGPGQVPKSACFDATGRVKDADGDGLPDCWETSGIDFGGAGTTDLTLCVDVNTNGDGVSTTHECANPNHKDLFVEIDYMQFHKPDPQALSQTQSVTTAGVKSVREAFAAAPVNNPDLSTGINIHFQVDEQLSHADQVIFTPCTQGTGSAGATVVDFDAIKAANFGTAVERGNQQTLNAKRLAFRYVVFGHNLAPLASNGGLGSSGCSEIGGDDGVVTLGSFSGSVAGHAGGIGNTDEQAGTLMHEFGHLLGLRHGGDDAINCKPNYRSVMSYSRQFSGSPIVGRRLDYSRSEDPVLADQTKTGLLNEGSLNELVGLGTDSSLGPIAGRNPGDVPFFASPDQIAFGPSAWAFSAANAGFINWNRNKNNKGVPIQDAAAAANINDGSGCTSLIANETLFGFDDWANILYRASAAIDFAGGRTSQEELTQQGAETLYLGSDLDGNFAGDGTDCGGTVFPDGTTSFPCKHRIDIKPSFSIPKEIFPGTEANITIAIFSEQNGAQVWNASTQVLLNDLVAHPLTFTVEPFKVSVKVNNKGGGTCSISDVADPITGQKDGIKDLKCQFPTGQDLNGNLLPAGTHFGVVNGWFFDPLSGTNRAFTARQEVTIIE